MTSSTASRFFSANSGCFSSKATRRSLPRSIGSYISFSPIASEIAITSILLMWSVMSSVLKVEWEPESSVMKT